MTSTGEPPIDIRSISWAIVRRGPRLATRTPGCGSGRRLCPARIAAIDCLGLSAALGSRAMHGLALSSIIAVAGLLAIAGPALAQQAGREIGVARPDIGRLETRIQRYDQALGVIAQFVRPLGAEVECNGICYFPSSTQPTSWRCAPTQRCDLHCEVSPPVGGCN